MATSNDNSLILDTTYKTRPDIVYPTEWGFKLIGRDKEKLLACIQEIMQDKDYTCRVGNVSRTGKFHSYNAACIVQSEAERNHLFQAFELHGAVDMVL